MHHSGKSYLPVDWVFSHAVIIKTISRQVKKKLTRTSLAFQFEKVSMAFCRVMLLKFFCQRIQLTALISSHILCNIHYLEEDFDFGSPSLFKVFSYLLSNLCP